MILSCHDSVSGLLAHRLLQNLINRIHRDGGHALEQFLVRAPNPLIPTFREAMLQALTPEEQERVIAYLKPRVEAGRGAWRMASAYLSAERPGAP